MISVEQPDNGEDPHLHEEWRSQQHNHSFYSSLQSRLVEKVRFKDTLDLTVI